MNPMDGAMDSMSIVKARETMTARQRVLNAFHLYKTDRVVEEFLSTRQIRNGM
jgi:hypothetical protein